MIFPSISTEIFSILTISFFIDPFAKDYVNNLRKAAQALSESYQ
jgi:hypothetical protein